MRHKHKKSIRLICISIMTLLLLTQILFITFWYNKTLDDTGYDAMTISQVAANSIKVNDYEKFLETKEHNDYFKQMQAYFHKIQVETGVEYVYIEHKISPDQIEYIFDSQKDSLGEIDEMYTPEAHTSLRSFYTREETSALWGTLITGYAPIINAKGEIIGAVGTDVDIHFIYTELVKRIGQIIIYTLVMVILFSLLIYFILNEEIRRRRIVENNLKRSMLSITNLLDNAGQGFLSFGPNLRIKPEYSKECLRLLGPDLENSLFPESVYSNNPEEKNFMEKVLVACFEEEDKERKEIFLSLLPKEIVINHNFIKLEYRIISGDMQKDSDALMLILTDATEKRVLQEQMEAERKTLKMIVQAVVNRNDLIEVITDYNKFCYETVPHLIIDLKPHDSELVDIKRTIHTFKGIFGQFEMFRVVGCLHDAEEKIKLFEKQSLVDSAGLVMLLKELSLEGALKEELHILQSVIGIDFLGKEKTIEIPESKLIELEDQIDTHFSSDEAKRLISMIRQLRYRRFKDLLAMYPNYVNGLAQTLNKALYPLELKGGEFLVDTTRYYAFTKSLVHIFVNCVDHGIENSEERMNRGKDVTGKILCEISLVDDSILLRITDDGKGIDSQAIIHKAVELGINGEELDALSDKEVTELILIEGLSSREGASTFSGRGIGMAIVKQELEKIGGHFEIMSIPGERTEFTFILPI